jgi:bla regulator protein blaR1
MTSWLPFDLLDHLWQSTLFAAAVWLVARTLRANGARVRYWLWFAASMKFLIPLSLLVSAGERFAWRTEPVASPAVVSFVIDQVLTPAGTARSATMVDAVALGTPIASPATAASWLLLAAWAAGVTFVLLSWWKQWLPFRRARAAANAIDVGAECNAVGLTIMASASMVEPGVFGIRRPVLLVPEGMDDRLSPAQLRALIAHEHCHVRHRDNLTAALHMTVEAVFWFYPIVWWIERRLVDERERACDEYVLQCGSTPHDYAEGILEVCRLATSPPPAFVAGVSGSDLRRRIRSILRQEIGRPLGGLRAAALGVCCAVAGFGPVLAGIAQEPDGITEAAFEVASVRKNVSGVETWAMNPRPTGQFEVINGRVATLVQAAYQLQDDQVQGMPEWARNTRIDISARLDPKIAAASQPDGLPPTWALALRALLKDRLQLAFHREIAQRPVYALMTAKPDGKVGSGMRPAEYDCDAMKARAVAAARSGGPSPYPPKTDTRIACGVGAAPGRFLQGGSSLDEFRGMLSRLTGRPVLDRTGLTGKWDFLLTYTPPDLLRAGELPRADSPDLFTALREQLGLKLESTTGPVEMFVIDRLEPPSEN